MKKWNFVLLLFFWSFVSCQNQSTVEQMEQVEKKEIIEDNDTENIEDSNIDDEVIDDDSIIDDDMDIDDDSEFVDNSGIDDNCYNECGWSVRLKLKPQKDVSYLAITDPVMIALVLKHDVKFKQSYPGVSYLELFLYYDLSRKDNMSWGSFKNAIRDFLMTGKFEKDIHYYGVAFLEN